MFLWETLRLIVAWIPGLLRTGTEEVSFQMSPMRSPALIKYHVGWFAHLRFLAFGLASWPPEEFPFFQYRRKGI